MGHTFLESIFVVTTTVPVQGKTQRHEEFIPFSLSLGVLVPWWLIFKRL
jgi:hypothetical protein